jgi:Tfp pilus assembly pilus retraction ATPase PilT
MPLDPQDPTVRAAMFGKQVEQFLSSDIGQYLVERANEQAEAAIKELLVVDPTATELIRATQNRVKVSDSILSWLRDAIQMGEQAQAQLREQ